MTRCAEGLRSSMSGPAFLDLYQLPAEERGRNTQARANIAPIQDVLIVHNDTDGRQEAETARWWLVPF